MGFQLYFIKAEKLILAVLGKEGKRISFVFCPNSIKVVKWLSDKRYFYLRIDYINK